jgi:hypothetical protein
MDDTNKLFARIYINIAIITVSVTAFFFIAGARPTALQDNLFAFQLILSAPLLLSSTLLLGKATAARNHEPYIDAANGFFIVGYAMLINSTGILVSQIANVYVAMMYFAAHIISILIYSWIVIGAEGDSVMHRFKKDLFFILLIILFGLVPTL